MLLFIELKYLPSLTGKLDGERSGIPSNCRFTASFRRHDVQICSATLLSNQHALTVATCLKSILNKRKIPSFDQFTLAAGRFDIDTEKTIFKIKQMQIHKRFRFHSPSDMYNIGLITVNYQDFLKFRILYGNLFLFLKHHYNQGISR